MAWQIIEMIRRHLDHNATQVVATVPSGAIDVEANADASERINNLLRQAAPHPSPVTDRLDEALLKIFA